VWLVVGLGNPGAQYERTRHNIGFRVVDELERRHGPVTFKTKLGAQVAEAKLGGERVLLCKPMEFMNVSGEAVLRVASFWKVRPSETIVVYDDIDLPFGRLKLATSGGHGGHNGVRSIIASWSTPDFSRVRFGVGRPPGGHDAAGYVLAPFSRAEEVSLPQLTGAAADAVETTVTHGLTAAMNRFNSKVGFAPAATGDDA
jgi:PTH1 family peptidyl-tRNA hydrolase